ncbi:MAG TPA: multidrug effflux MFS transporter [Cyclobacteriaceae bacterium]|nr:multidrug effflux MFS transporter [Cyclobacteriaceae bacterium]
MAEANRNNNYIIWILGALATVSPFSIDMYLPAFSQIADEYGTTPAKISLSVSSYFIGLAIGQMLYGPLLDRFGRKRPLYFGLIIFIIASVGCMQSQTIETLVVFRFVQALGGCVAWVGAMAMVRDFFPVKESAKIFSLLVLILGVSPLLAPTFGSFIAVSFGWQAIFIMLAVIVFLILLITFFFLPEGQQPDHSVSLKAKPMLKTFYSVLREPQFFTYTFSGAFSFATLFIYVAGSPIIFMEMYQVSPQVYGGLFALLSVGFIGSSQINILLVRRFSSEQLFRVALYCQVMAGVVFLSGVYFGVFGLYGTLAMFFISLCCIGIINPNATALALAPFTRNVGSASALLGCTQIGVAALASSFVGLFNSSNTVPIVGLLSATSITALVILVIGQRRIVQPVDAVSSSDQVAH